jgi:lipopolysaccharide transport system permease protein
MQTTTNKLIINSNSKNGRYWRDIFAYRELLNFFIWRDLLIRYKQTVIGVSWILIRPIITMIIFTILFGNVVKLPSEGIPYPILVAIGTLPWQFFSNALTDVSNSLINSSSLIGKVYFPKIFIPFSSATVCLIDFLVSLLLLVSLMIFYKVAFSYNLLLIPLLIFLMFFNAFGLGLLFSALNVKFRDFKYIVPFIAQLSLYISPVGYSSTIIPEKYKLIYSLNPLVGIIEGFRWTIVVNKPFPIVELTSSLVIIFIITLFGFMYYKRTESNFADII